MRSATIRSKKYSRSFLFRAVFVGVVFTLSVIYQKTFPDNKRKELEQAALHDGERLYEDYDNTLEQQLQQQEGATGVPQVPIVMDNKWMDTNNQGNHQLPPGGLRTQEEIAQPKGLLSHLGILRKLLYVGRPHPILANDTWDNDTSTELPPHNHSEHHLCTPPAYHEFPTDVFTSDQRKSGAIVLHLIMVIYMFTALAVVCDIYFVASLEKICEKLNLSADVAGATFMAAGSSAPELFTSIIGVFIAKGDVGVGTIVGSAVFNILFVVGICGVLVSTPVPLTWYPLMRDSFFYIISVIMLIGSIADATVTWYESSMMLVVYIIYIIVMKFNPHIQAWITPRVHLFAQSMHDDAKNIMMAAAKTKNYGAGNTYDGTTTNVTEMFTNEPNGGATEPGSYQTGVPPPGMTNARPATVVAGPGGVGQSKVIPVDDYVLKSTRKISFEDACFRFMKMRGFRPKTRFWAAVCIVICERRKLLRDPVFMRREQQAIYTYGSVPESYANPNKPSVVDAVEAPEPANDWKRIPRSDEGYVAQVKWAVLLPINIILYYTVPDCGQQRWQSWFMVSFFMSIVWIAAFSYVMVWMVTLIGFTIGIPDSIMGITFLAAGTSVPDAMASVMVARQGQGDMAVSNTIGSNVFDVLIGLALPWWLMTVCVQPGSAVHINSNGMVFSVILLFLTVIIAIVAIHTGGWKLDKKLGIICLCCYAVFLTFSCMIEYNVFGYVNPPMCTE